MAQQGRTGLQTLVDGFTDGGLNPASEFRTLGTDLNDSSLNLTDDISTGTWTPTLIDDGGGATYTIGTTNLAQQYRIGDLVHVWADLSGITASGTASGTLLLSGLPFTSAAGGNYAVVLGHYANFLGDNFYSVKAEVVGNSTNIHFRIQDSLDTGYSVPITAQDFNGRLSLYACYLRVSP